MLRLFKQIICWIVGHDIVTTTVSKKFDLYRMDCLRCGKGNGPIKRWSRVEKINVSRKKYQGVYNESNNRLNIKRKNQHN